MMQVSKQLLGRVVENMESQGLFVDGVVLPNTYFKL